jgi:hypothetical protein
MSRDIRRAAARRNQTPLEYALQVMRDPQAPVERRDRMAAVAMPFVHSRPGEQAKKEAAKVASERAAEGTSWEALLDGRPN